MRPTRDPFHLLHLLVVVLAEEEIPLGAASGTSRLCRRSYAGWPPPSRLPSPAPPRDLQDSSGGFVRVEQELDALLVSRALTKRSTGARSARG